MAAMTDTQLKQKMDQFVSIGNRLHLEAQRRYGRDGNLFHEADGGVFIMDGDDNGTATTRQTHIKHTAQIPARWGAGAWVLLFAFLFAVGAHAQAPAAPAVFHVTGVHDHIRTADEDPSTHVLHSRVVVGTVGGLRYTLEEAAMFAPRYEVGTDYPVVKITDKDITLLVTDKKGRTQKDGLRVANTEEVTK